MKRWIAIACCVIVLAGCLVGCGSAPEGAEDSSATVETQEKVIFVSPATDDFFFSLESFLDYAAGSQSGDGLGNVASLEYFYLPTGIPEGYNLYRITANASSVNFWYIPEAAFFGGSFPSAESHYFGFVSPRKHYNGAGGDNRLMWEDGMDYLMLNLPKDYVIEDRDALCRAEKFTKTADGSFVNEQGVDARSFTDREEPVFSDAFEITLLEANAHGGEFTFQLHNPTDKIYAYSKGCRFEVLQGETWSTLAYGLNITEYDVGKLYPDWSADITYEVYHIQLEPGTYRIVIEFQPVEEDAPELVSCEFTVE